MQQQKTDSPAGEPEMHRRQITMEDGRYMIFYTFGVQTGEEGAAAPAAGPHTPDIEAGEEPHV